MSVLTLEPSNEFEQHEHTQARERAITDELKAKSALQAAFRTIEKLGCATHASILQAAQDHADRDEQQQEISDLGSKLAQAERATHACDATITTLEKQVASCLRTCKTELCESRTANQKLTYEEKCFMLTVKELSSRFKQYEGHAKSTFTQMHTTPS